MSVIYKNLTFKTNFPGQPEDGTEVRFVTLKCNNTLAEVTTAGFLDLAIKSQGLTIHPSDFIAVAAINGHQWYKPVFTGTSVQLVVLP